MRLPYNQKMFDRHMSEQIALGGVVGSHLVIEELPIKKISKHEYIPELNIGNPEMDGFYNLCYSLYDTHTKKLFEPHRRRAGGLNTYPIGYGIENFIKSRIFVNQYKIGLCNFEMAVSLLPQAVIDKLMGLYLNIIRHDIQKYISHNTDDSICVVHNSVWEPPHFHFQNSDLKDDIDCISYGVKICGTTESSSIFDVIGDSCRVSIGSNNPITKIIFKGKYIHQAFRTDPNDDSLFFFFLWDGVKWLNTPTYDLDKKVYIERWMN